MKKSLSVLLLSLVISFWCKGQSLKDVFSETSSEFTWLGIDYSNVKLIGDFSRFIGTSEVSSLIIKTTYFLVWNNLVLDEPLKYDIRKALRKDVMQYDVSEVHVRNEGVNHEKMMADYTPNYSREEIQEMLRLYDFKGKQGLGVLFIAESLNESSGEAYYHVVIVNMITKELLLYERMRGGASGIGFRNYWAGSIRNVIKKINTCRYKSWKWRYLKRGK